MGLAGNETILVFIQLLISKLNIRLPDDWELANPMFNHSASSIADGGLYRKRDYVRFHIFANFHFRAPGMNSTRTYVDVT